MAEETFDPTDADALKNIRSMFGPQEVDNQIRRAIQYCWLSLPPETKNADELEKQIRRLVDRALRDFRDDADHFGFAAPK